MSGNTNIHLGTDWLTQNIGWIFLGVVILVIFVPIISNKFYKGRIRRIKVVKKRVTTRELLNFSYTKFNTSNYETFEHKTVDFVYDGRKITHTLNCYGDVFAKLHKDMVYDVVIRFNTITKIVKVYK